MTVVDRGALSMDTDATLALADRLAATATSFRQQWTQVLATITASEAHLGQGRIGGQFREQYNPAAIGVVGSIGQAADALQQGAAAVRTTVADYLRADAEGAQGFR